MARGDPWKARLWNLGIKRLTFEKKFIDFHQNFVVKKIFSEYFPKSENQKSKMLIIAVVILKYFRFFISEKSQLELLTFSNLDFQISKIFAKIFFRS